MAAPVTPGPSLRIGPLSVLFRTGNLPDGVELESYDAAPDGSRFIFERRVQPAAGEGTRLVLIQNWPAAIGR